MPWLLWIAPCAGLALAIAALLRRRAELRSLARNLGERATARARGSHEARLQHPDIDLQKCIGCGACVRACPEDGVLALSFGQAVVVHGARCVGHGRCADVCPTGAIALTLGDLEQRRDLPAIDAGFEAIGRPGLFLAGEITGFALVRTAVQHGVTVAREVARRAGVAPRRARRRVHAGVGGESHTTAPAAAPLDLAIIGLGPAGLACALASKQAGLRFLAIEQAADVGGTVAAYPRKKLVMTQPMELPLHGRLDRPEYSKEELVELWQRLVREHRLPVKTGASVLAIEPEPDGTFRVVTAQGVAHARHVCLALGRRGTPRRLDVPGEDLPKVAYALLDAEGHRDRSVLVVGGGDSAVEAALALAEQPGNAVTLSYRKDAFFRLKARNDERIAAAVAAGRVQVLFGSEVLAIEPDAVRLRCSVGDGEQEVLLPNDDVFVFAGGTPPFALLESAGVSFDPALRPAPAPATDRGTGLLVALVATLVGSLALLGVRIVRADYYDLPPGERTGSAWHEVLRAQGSLGLCAGLASVLLFLVNLLYLARRSRSFGRFLPGSLRAWMSLHVATGLSALLAACLHSGFSARDSVAGHALLAMAGVVLTGMIGRWFYAFVPRVQNGKQADLEELGAQVAALAGEWDQDARGFGQEVQRQVEGLVAAERFGRGFFAHVFGLLRSEWHLVAKLRRLRRDGAAAGVPAAEIARLLALAQRAHRLSLQLAHYEEVRGVLASWRWLHRWLCLLLLLLMILHIGAALRFGGVDFEVLQRLGGGR
jgi:thioredoxin reductase/ferredoxin